MNNESKISVESNAIARALIGNTANSISEINIDSSSDRHELENYQQAVQSLGFALKKNEQIFHYLKKAYASAKKSVHEEKSPEEIAPEEIAKEVTYKEVW